jgi:hypothetical protein
MTARPHRGRAVLATHWQIGAGLLAGLLLMPPIQVEYAAWAERRELERQRALPVVTSEGQIVGRGPSYVDIRLSGYKHRECDILDVTGFRVPAGQVASDLTDVYRLDGPNRRATRPIGPWHGGVWRLYVATDERGWIQIRHSCDGRVLQTVLARVEPQGQDLTEEP